MMSEIEERSRIEKMDSTKQKEETQTTDPIVMKLKDQKMD
jgi:hypothetical protein